MQKIEETQTHLGTPIHIQVVAYDKDKAQRAIERAFAEAARIERHYSRFIKGNRLAEINSRIGEWTEVEDELFELISFGVRTNERTNGAFDLTVKSILDGWGYDENYSLTESEPGGTGLIELDEGRVRIMAEIDLGGLGKGYAIDRMVNQLADFQNVMVNAGGDIFARGKDVDGPWKVALEHPTDTEKAVGIVELDGLALGASSPLRRNWRDRHHLVEPKTAQPAGQMLAVFTQAPAALIADTYSTALFAMGFEDAQKAIHNLPIEAFLIGPDGRGWMSEGFEGTLFS